MFFMLRVISHSLVMTRNMLKDHTITQVCLMAYEKNVINKPKINKKILVK